MFLETRKIKEAPPKWYRDIYGLFFAVLTPVILDLITFAPLIGCLAGVDPTNFVFPEPNGIVQQCLHFLARFVLFGLACTQILATPVTYHLSIFTLVIYSKTCIGYLKGYKRPRNPTDPSKFDFLSDLQLYQIITLIYRVASSTSIIIIPSIFGSGLFISVTSNYVVLMLYPKLPLLLYLSIVGLAAGALIIIAVELPQAGQAHTKSAGLMRYWKKSTGRKSLRRKTLEFFYPVEIWMGPFFILSRDTFFSFVQEILNKTVDFILLL